MVVFEAAARVDVAVTPALVGRSNQTATELLSALTPQHPIEVGVTAIALAGL